MKKYYFLLVISLIALGFLIYDILEIDYIYKKESNIEVFSRKRIRA